MRSTWLEKSALRHLRRVFEEHGSEFYEDSNPYSAGYVPSFVLRETFGAKVFYALETLEMRGLICSGYNSEGDRLYRYDDFDR